MSTLNKIKGPIFKIPKKDVDTDQIIPAQYLTKSDKLGFGPHVFEGMEYEGFDRNGEDFNNAVILVVDDNFGCGSSREHAVWAIQAHGIKAIIGTFFARIFYQNCIACGLPAISVSEEEIRSIFDLENSAEVDVDLENKEITADGGKMNFALEAYDEALLKTGGLVGFAHSKYGGT